MKKNAEGKTIQTKVKQLQRMDGLLGEFCIEELELAPKDNTHEKLMEVILASKTFKKLKDVIQNTTTGEYGRYCRKCYRWIPMGKYKNRHGKLCKRCYNRKDAKYKKNLIHVSLFLGKEMTGRYAHIFIDPKGPRGETKNIGL